MSLGLAYRISKQYYLNLKKSRLPKSRAGINKSGSKLLSVKLLLIGGYAISRAVNATTIPYNTCLLGFTGDVMGSGSITREKNKTLGSNILLIIDCIDKVKVNK